MRYLVAWNLEQLHVRSMLMDADRIRHDPRITRAREASRKTCRIKIQNSQMAYSGRASAVPRSFQIKEKSLIITRNCNVPYDCPSLLFVLVSEVHYVDLLTGMLGPDVRHHIGRLLAAELAIGTLEARRLAALVLVMPGHIALDGEAAATLGTTEGLVVDDRALRMIDISHAAMRKIIRR